MKYRITDIHRSDSYYETKEHDIGRVIEADTVTPSKFADGFKTVEAGRELFIAVKIEEVKE